MIVTILLSIFSILMIVGLLLFTPMLSIIGGVGIVVTLYLAETYDLYGPTPIEKVSRKEILEALRKHKEND